MNQNMRLFANNLKYRVETIAVINSEKNILLEKSLKISRYQPLVSIYENLNF